jgi:hypothetical protein
MIFALNFLIAFISYCSASLSGERWYYEGDAPFGSQDALAGGLAFSFFKEGDSMNGGIMLVGWSSIMQGEPYGKYSKARKS